MVWVSIVYGNESLYESGDMTMANQKKIEAVLERAKKVGAEYYRLTGKPLGVTAEVGEYLAAKHLGLKLAKVREAGYDAIGADGRLVQIKSRVTEDGKKKGRVSAIRLDHEWDTVVFVLMDRYFEPKAMYEADRKAVEEALLKPGSKARNERGQLSITTFIKNSDKVWPAD